MTQLRQVPGFRWRQTLALLTLAHALTGTAPAQTAAADSGNAARGIQEGAYSLIDVGGFVGGQFFQLYQGDTNRAHRLDAGIYLGARVTENVSRHISIEEQFAFGNNREKFLPGGNNAFASVAERNYTLGLLGLYNLTPRDAKYRPYLFAGPGWESFRPSGLSSITPPSSGPYAVPFALGPSNSFALLYGLGFKVNVNRRIALRFDATGKVSKAAHVDLPASPQGPGGLYVPAKGRESGVAVSVGIDFRMKYHEPPPPPRPEPKPEPKPEPPPPPPPVQVRPITGARDVCAGDNLVLTTGATGGAPGATMTYQWMVNGQPVAGANGATFSLPTAGSPGAKSVTVRASAGDLNATSPAVSVNVMALLPPTIQFTVNPSTTTFGGAAIPLAARAAAANACNGNLTVSYSGEGVTGASFNPGALGGFDQTNRLRQQTRTIPLTATVRDAHNQNASANANVTVTLNPQASRRDIVFPNRSARVNNAAKRYLLEELTPRLRDDPNATVILIGHRDMGETGRAAATLDTQRVNNSAAVLSAGKGVCGSLDLSRVQVNAAGTDQTSTPAPFADASVQERTGQAVSATDQRAQFRRVEVWFVPGGADKPALSGLQSPDVKTIQALGCPK